MRKLGPIIFRSLTGAKTSSCRGYYSRAAVRAISVEAVEDGDELEAFSEGDESLASTSSSTESGRETIYATTRSKSGRLATKQHRKAGRTPAILFSLPGNVDQLITLSKRQADSLVSSYGRSGLKSRVFSLQVKDESLEEVTTYPVLPKMIHITAATQVVENITFMHCPPERVVRAEIPIKLLGEDVCPGVKKGGFVNVLKRRIKCLTYGGSVPANIEVDVSTLNLGDKVWLTGLNIPSDVVLNEKHLGDPVCRVAGKASRE